MSMAVTFDTLDYAKKLEGAGVPAAQAEQQTKILAEVLGRTVALPSDLASLERNLTSKAQADKAELKNDLALFGQKLTGDINLTKWMLGSLMAVNVAIALKLFLN